MPVSKATLEEIALSEKEYELIVRQLGREPTEVELGMFGALWSEHCGYKHSRPLLKRFPSTSKLVRTKVGEENAGAVDIGDGLLIVMKVESHNHPSAIEPFQGAATGVGGIVRDIFTMGARPIALLNSLRFGPPDDPRNRYLFEGVVGGIGSYGNCLGIPDVAGEIYFSPAYTHNPLVNAMCVGLASGSLVTARASGEGNLLMLVGADTGRDGLHGASGLASRTFEDQRGLRSAVQVGNPFLEKLLIEACLELAKTDWIVGMQDLGAAGLTSSSVESAAKGGSGLDIDVLKVPRREEGMNAYEVMLSESQERMLVVVKRGYEDKVKGLFQRWDLRCDIIGKVTSDGLARIREGAKVVAEAPVALLSEPPFYTVPCKKPGWVRRLQAKKLGRIKDVRPKDVGPALVRLLASPTIASKEPVYRQYDHQVLTNTVIAPGSGDAAVLRIKGTKKAIALTIDGNGQYCYLDPYQGGAIAVAEAARNLACSGARPLALTNCLNFGNPEKPDIYYQLKECIRGMARACRVFKIPVISGNVSLYNETRGQAIYPTPVVGMLGLIDNVEQRCGQGFQQQGDLVFLLGEEGDEDSLAGSAYLEQAHCLVAGRPSIDLDAEKRLQRTLLLGIKRGIIRSAHDCSEGGLLVALAESCVAHGLGFGFKGAAWPKDGRLDARLFGEAQSRAVVSVDPRRARGLAALAAKQGVPLRKLGAAEGKRFSIPGLVDLPLGDLEQAWRGGLEASMR